jgi:hypothetical protein
VRLDPSADNSGYAGVVRVVRNGGSARMDNGTLEISRRARRMASPDLHLQARQRRGPVAHRPAGTVGGCPNCATEVRGRAGTYNGMDSPQHWVRGRERNCCDHGEHEKPAKENTAHMMLSCQARSVLARNTAAERSPRAHSLRQCRSHACRSHGEQCNRLHSESQVVFRAASVGFTSATVGVKISKRLHWLFDTGEQCPGIRWRRLSGRSFRR